MNAQHFITKNPFEEHREELSTATLSAFLLHWVGANAALSLSFRPVKWLFFSICSLTESLLLGIGELSLQYYCETKVLLLSFPYRDWCTEFETRLCSVSGSCTSISEVLLKCRELFVTLGICYTWNNTAHGSEPKLRTCFVQQNNGHMHTYSFAQAI